MRFDEQEIFATTKEDPRQVISDVPVVMQRQVPVIQRVQRTMDIPLVQYNDTQERRFGGCAQMARRR